MCGSLSGVGLQVQSPGAQVTLQVVPLHFCSHFPPVQVRLQVVLLQICWQLPPEQVRLQVVEPAAHVWAHFPPVHSKLQVVSAQVCGQLPAVHVGSGALQASPQNNNTNNKDTNSDHFQPIRSIEYSPFLFRCCVASGQSIQETHRSCESFLLWCMLRPGRSFRVFVCIVRGRRARRRLLRRCRRRIRVRP